MIIIGLATQDTERLTVQTVDTIENARDFVDVLNKAVATINQIKGMQQKDDCWFVQVGDPVCNVHCPICEGSPHHWMFDAHDATDDEDDSGKDHYPEGRMVCKHCETWRDITDNDEE